MTEFLYGDNDGFNDNYDDNFGNFDDNYDKNDQKHTITVKFEQKIAILRTVT